ncbi:MAG: serine/threonine protein kinase, partial [Planctomycetes bacterium]|nr:serine/threonine protein kinase [Planctomycetota bacterium]
MSSGAVSVKQFQSDNDSHIIACPFCFKKYRIKVELLGNSTNCRQCARRFLLAHEGSKSQSITARTFAATEELAVSVCEDGSYVGEGVVDSLKSGARDQRYIIGDEIARGGMGAILKSRDINLGRNVAMKVVINKKLSHIQKLRFVEEAQITGQLEHPNIVPVHELGIDENGSVFYTMKLVRGKTLKDILRLLAKGDAAALKQYPLDTLIHILIQVCDALAYAHDKAVVHRDLKPENIMIGDFGEVQVMDWGLAKIIHAPQENDVLLNEADEYHDEETPENNSEISGKIATIRDEGNIDVTLEGRVVGTPQFMSPEQAEGRIADVAPTTDVYALGAMFYQILTLRPPVVGKNVDELLDKVASGDIAVPTDYNSNSIGRSGQVASVQSRKQRRAAGGDEAQNIQLKHCPNNKIPQSLSAVCMKAMSRKQGERYQKVSEFQEELRSYRMGFATDAEEATNLRQILLFVTRHKSESTFAAVALVSIIVFASLFIYNLKQSEAHA